TQFGVVPSAINLPAGEPSDSRADERVGREVLLPADARVGNRCRGAVREYFCEGAGILMADHAGNGPGCGGMAGGKGIAILPESSAKGISGGPLAARRKANRRGDKQAIQCGLAA